MKKGIIKKGIQFYKRYGIRGGIATLTGQGQMKDKNYAAWYEKNKVSEEELAIQRNKEFPYMPLFSILVPVYNLSLIHISFLANKERRDDVAAAYGEEKYSDTGFWFMIPDYLKSEDIQSCRIICKNGNIISAKKIEM